MNQAMQDFARGELKDGLSDCSEKQQMFFKRMYSPDNLDIDINKCVDGMPFSKLSFALDQVEATRRN